VLSYKCNLFYRYTIYTGIKKAGKKSEILVIRFEVLTFWMVLFKVLEISLLKSILPKYNLKIIKISIDKCNINENAIIL